MLSGSGYDRVIEGLGVQCAGGDKTLFWGLGSRGDKIKPRIINEGGGKLKNLPVGGQQTCFIKNREIKGD